MRIRSYLAAAMAKLTNSLGVIVDTTISDIRGMPLCTKHAGISPPMFPARLRRWNSKMVHGAGLSMTPGRLLSWRRAWPRWRRASSPRGQFYLGQSYQADHVSWDGTLRPVFRLGLIATVTEGLEMLCVFFQGKGRTMLENGRVWREDGRGGGRLPKEATVLTKRAPWRSRPVPVAVPPASTATGGRPKRGMKLNVVTCIPLSASHVPGMRLPPSVTASGGVVHCARGWSSR
ncbi:hypothetical protein J3F84DRAFT_76312 [Trichoderma pleuroticola]